MGLSKSKINLFIANFIWKVGSLSFKLADFTGEYKFLFWQQKYWDKLGDACMGLSAKYALKGYWLKKGIGDW